MAGSPLWDGLALRYVVPLCRALRGNLPILLGLLLFQMVLGRQGFAMLLHQFERGQEERRIARYELRPKLPEVLDLLEELAVFPATVANDLVGSETRLSEDLLGLCLDLLA